MKKTLCLVMIIISILVSSQQFPTAPVDSFRFPLGSKFTLKMIPDSEGTFEFSVLNAEIYQEIVDSWEYQSLFEEKEKNGTLEGYFVIGTHVDTEEEKESNMKILLILKNRTDENLSYISNILLEVEGEFQNTSNVGVISGSIATEMWPYMIEEIELEGFEKMGK